MGLNPKARLENGDYTEELVLKIFADTGYGFRSVGKQLQHFSATSFWQAGNTGNSGLITEILDLIRHIFLSTHNSYF